MAIFVSDTFTEASTIDLTSHTGEIGATWTVCTGYTDSPRVSGAGDNALGGDTTKACASASGIPAGTEYDIEADYIRTGGQPIAGLTFRGVSDEDTFYIFRGSSGDVWEFYKNVDNSFSLLSSKAQTIGTGTFALRVECRDATKKFFVDDVEIDMASNNNDLSDKGLVGMRWAAAGINNRFDNFVATDAVVGGIAKVNGIAWADLAEFNGVLKVDIGKVNGVSVS